MVPSKFAFIASLPKTGNGKLDRKALTSKRDEPVLLRSVERPVEGVEDPVMTAITDIMEDVLDCHDLRPGDRLFSLGGNSLHIFRIAARLRQRNLPIAARDLLKNPSIAEMVEMARVPAVLERTNAAGPSLAGFKQGARRNVSVS
jgi:aryl carrier-like protein